jgi:hypothetical protein
MKSNDLPPPTGRRVSRRPGKWLLGCGMGCGVLLVLVLVSIGVGSFVMQQPFRNAIDTREELEEVHGQTESFTPGPDGTIPSDRIEAFLRVRRALQEVCKELEESSAQFEALDDLDDEGEPTGGEIRGALWGAVKSAFGMGSQMGEFFRIRNSTLAEVDMGLGEYTYLYVLTYTPRLRSERPGRETRLFSERVRSDLRQMLHNQRTAIGARREDTGVEFSDLLDREITALESDTGRLPWEESLPPQIEASLAPYREELDALFCPDAFSLELTRNERFGIGIRGD